MARKPKPPGPPPGPGRTDFPHGDQHGPPLRRGGTAIPIGHLNVPKHYTGPQPSGFPNNGLIGPPLRRGGSAQGTGGSVGPGKPSPQYKSGDRAAKLRELRKKAGITRYELQQSPKLNKLASQLGTDYKGKRDLSQIRELIMALRNSGGINPKGRKFSPDSKGGKEVRVRDLRKQHKHHYGKFVKPEPFLFTGGRRYKGKPKPYTRPVKGLPGARFR